MRLRKIPATVVTGFLGAGKTTLVNRLLACPPPVHVGIIVNEFGEIGIDGQLIVAEEEALVEINNGCICCTVRKDLVKSVAKLMARSGDWLERLIIETSGLADPAPVLQTFLADPDVRDRVELESVVAVVDARHFDEQLHDQIAREQVVFADRVIINKTDLIEVDRLSSLMARIHALNPTALIDTALHCAVDVSAMLGVRHLSIDNLLTIEPSLLDSSAHDHQHDNTISSYAFVIPGSLDGIRFNRWANSTVNCHGRQLMRMKGILNLYDESRRLYFHSVHMLLEADFGKAWHPDECRDSKLVMIGRDLDMPTMREALFGCIH
jgi:G3E family GTPase